MATLDPINISLIADTWTKILEPTESASISIDKSQSTSILIAGTDGAAPTSDKPAESLGINKQVVITNNQNLTYYAKANTDTIIKVSK